MPDGYVPTLPDIQSPGTWNLFWPCWKSWRTRAFSPFPEDHVGLIPQPDKEVTQTCHGGLQSRNGACNLVTQSKDRAAVRSQIPMVSSDNGILHLQYMATDLTRLQCACLYMSCLQCTLIWQAQQYSIISHPAASAIAGEGRQCP